MEGWLVAGCRGRARRVRVLLALVYKQAKSGRLGTEQWTGVHTQQIQPAWTPTASTHISSCADKVEIRTTVARRCPLANKFTHRLCFPFPVYPQFQKIQFVLEF